MYSVFLAYILWFFGGFGCLGLHRHYLGKHATGFLWLFTGGVGMLGSCYDLLTIPQQVKDANLKMSIYHAGVASLKGLPSGIPAEPKAKKITLEQLILRAAKQNRGLITPSQVAVEGDYDLETIRVELERLAARGYCEMRVTSSGAMVFRFNDFARGPEETFDI